MNRLRRRRRSQNAQLVLHLLWKDRQLNVDAAESLVRPPSAPTGHREWARHGAVNLAATPGFDSHRDSHDCGASR